MRLAAVLAILILAATAQDETAFSAVQLDGKPLRDITARSVTAHGVYVTRGSGEASSIWFINSRGPQRIELDGPSTLWDFHAACSFWTGSALPGAWATVKTDDGERVVSLTDGKATIVTTPDGKPLTGVRLRAASESLCAVVTRHEGLDRVWKLKGASAEAMPLEARYSRGATRLVAAGARLLLYTREQNSPDGDNRRLLATRDNQFKAVMEGDEPVRDEPTMLDGSMRFEIALVGTTRLWRGGETDALLTVPPDTRVVNAVVRDGAAWADLALTAARRRVAREVEGKLVEFRREEKQPVVNESLFVNGQVFSCGGGQCWEQLPDGKRRRLTFDDEALPYLQYTAGGRVTLVTGYQYLAPAVFALRDGELVAIPAPFETRPKAHFPAVTDEGAYLFASDDNKVWRVYRMPLAD
ncbi:MAG: hypothetical protein KF696_09570 [Planctomycetes bacterium]|nr:hypothetical protein [Planctomycetota bacterium]MCW8136106.1 hypothetical protein [Planctomycetota bacterium]